MRSFLAGILLCWPALVLGQARGQVESIGFGGAYRPGCWTPMVIQLVPTSGQTFTGRIEVIQEDLDKDQAIFTRQITLTGNPANGPAREDRFWMYFLPQPNRDKGALDDNLRNDELSALIRVRLCDDKGKELVKIPITQTIRRLEQFRGSMSRGQRVVLCVYDQHPPNLSEYFSMTGLNEDVATVGARKLATELPDDVRGYDAIDGICWSDANPMDLSAEQLTAIEEFVRRGGRMVVTQDTSTNQWQRNNVKFPLMMPVNVRGVEERDDKLATLRQLARVPTPARDKDDALWDTIKGPFRYAVGEVKPGAAVVQWQRDANEQPLLGEDGKPKPYAVRAPFGAGSVTWVAQDLGDRQILGERVTTRGWSHVWDEVFDWPNEPVFDSKARDDRKIAPYRDGVTWDLGRAFLKHMDLDSTSAALIGIAVLFFIGYWIAAGPGSYFVLLRKGKSAMSWFTFAAIAIGATGLTVGIVKLVLRGAPQLKHVTLVRMTPGEPANVHSGFGLYIPRDGAQKIELKDAAAGRPAYVTAFNLHPAFNSGETDFPARQDYYVPVKELHEADREAADPKVIRVPYRSTLKKFQAHWSGNLPGGFDASVKLAADVPLVQGWVTNSTGHDLRMVYLVVHHPAAAYVTETEFEPRDLVLFVSRWKNGDRIDLKQQFELPRNGGAATIKATSSLIDESNPNAATFYQGMINQDRGKLTANSWTEFWYARQSATSNESWRQGYGGGDFQESNPLTPFSFPLLSFYDRIPVSRNEAQTGNQFQSGKAIDRVDFLRRGLRAYDMSAAISAGQMAIIGVSAGDQEKLPFPLEVEGDRIDGKGVIYYQYVVPVDRSAVTRSPIKPAAPATQPSKGKAGG